MGRTVFALLCSLVILAPALASAAGDVVAVDSKVLANAKVERNGKQVGTVQRVMVNPTTGRIEHVDIVMNEGQQRVVAVPWSGLRVFQDNGGNITLSLTSRAASEASPSASPSTAASTPRKASTPTPSATMDVRAAQRELKERGFYSGPIDGVIGAATQAALRAYQRDRGLTVTGRLDSPTVRSLSS